MGEKKKMGENEKLPGTEKLPRKTGCKKGRNHAMSQSHISHRCHKGHRGITMRLRNFLVSCLHYKLVARDNKPNPRFVYFTSAVSRKLE